MIPTQNAEVYDESLRILEVFGESVSARGRFIALYLGLRRFKIMSPAQANGVVPSTVLQDFLDQMYTKIHVPAPLIVLTALFGQSTSPNAPYSTKTGEKAPGNITATNTWRNNFGIQKGVGCPAPINEVNELLGNPGIRLACPHMSTNAKGENICALKGTAYRGDEHSIWLQLAEDGYTIVDLDLPLVYQNYLYPKGNLIPIFPLISALYSFAPEGFYPPRTSVTILDFAADFGYDEGEINALFDCDPESAFNASLISVALVQKASPLEIELAEQAGLNLVVPPPGQVPSAVTVARMNIGIGAEILVARDLEAHGWIVGYRGNQQGIGYDLEGTREGAIIRVEVKSSVGFCVPLLSISEWEAAQNYGEEFILATVDFLESEHQKITYVRNPAALVTPTEVPSIFYRIQRHDVHGVGTDAEFL